MGKDKLEKMLESMPQTNLPFDKKEHMLDAIMQHRGKSKGLYVIFFILLLLINSYIYFNIIYRNFVYFEPWNHHYSTDIITVLLYLIIIIPLTAFLSEKLAIYAIKKGLGNSRNFKVFIAVIIIVPISLFSFKMFNDYREKDLDDVISFNISSFDHLIINDKWVTDKEEHAEDLNELLSHYRVKKVKDYQWNSDTSKEQGFLITIYSNGKPIMASILENRLIFYNDGDYYKVLNGPINMDWFEEMYEDYQQ